MLLLKLQQDSTHQTMMYEQNTIGHTKQNFLSLIEMSVAAFVLFQIPFCKFKADQLERSQGRSRKMPET